MTRVSSACSLTSSSHSTGCAFTTTPARLTALSSPLTDDCLLASTWDYAGTTCHTTLIAGNRQQTSNTYSIKHRSRVRETNFRHHHLHILWHVCRTTSTVRFSLYTSSSVPVSITASIYPNYAFRPSCPLPRMLQHLRNYLRAGGIYVGTSHMRDNQQMTTAMQRLADFISMVTNRTLLCNNTRAVTTMERICDFCCVRLNITTRGSNTREWS
jgi:hypothetical protein